MKKVILFSFIFILLGFVSNAQMTLVPSKPFCKPHSFNKGKYSLNPGELPKFPGGDSLMQAYTVKNLVLNDKLHKKASGEIITVIFDVDTSGKLWNIRFNDEKEVHNEIEQAAINLICNMPDWIPAVLRYRDDTVPYSAIVQMVAYIHFWAKENGVEKSAYIELLDWPKSILYKPNPQEKDVFQFAEKLPVFEGDYEEYIKANMKYPEKEKKEGKQGTVYISFIIEKDGSVSGVRVQKEIVNAPGLTDEAIRLISSMPKWIPGEMNGKPIRLRCSRSVVFTL